MTTIFIVSFLTAFLAVAALLYAPYLHRARAHQTLDRLSAYETVPGRAGMAAPLAGGVASTGTLTAGTFPAGEGFADRLLLPALTRIAGMARRWVDTSRSEPIRKKLFLAGVRKLSAEQFLAIKVSILAVAGLLYSTIAMSMLIVAGRSPWLLLPLVIGSYFLPDLWLRQRITKRQREIGRVLSDAIDIMTIAIEAGLAFDSALAKVAKHIGGPLGEEFGRTLWDLQMGISRTEAIRNLGERTTVAELQSFCATVVQADNFGISISKILRAQAVEIRTRRRQAAEEAALKTPVKLVFPVVLLILPALMIIIIGPGVLRIAEALFN